MSKKVWRIVEQTEKTGKQEKKVKVKHVKFFPQKDKATGMVSFGRLGFICLKMVVRYGKTKPNTIVWSDYFKDGVGKFTFKQPTKMVPQYERDITNNRVCKDRKGNPIVNHMLPPVEVEGEKTVYDNHTLFAEWLIKHMGTDTAAEIITLFAQRMTDVTTRQAASKAKREADAAKKLAA